MSDAPERYVLERPCPKCGTGPTPSVFCGQTTPGLSPWASFHPYVPEGGHHHRKCLHCGFERIELALDAAVMTGEERHEAIRAAVAEWREAQRGLQEDLRSLREPTSKRLGRRK